MKPKKSPQCTPLVPTGLNCRRDFFTAKFFASETFLHAPGFYLLHINLSSAFTFFEYAFCRRGNFRFTYLCYAHILLPFFLHAKLPKLLGFLLRKFKRDCFSCWEVYFAEAPLRNLFYTRQLFCLQVFAGYLP